MKKKTRERNMKKISIICIVAIVVALATLFVNCWSFTGVTENLTTGEKRVAEMEMSLASYVWFPTSEAGFEFTKYVNNPALRYKEEVTTMKLTSKKIEDITNTLVEAEIIKAPKEKKNTEVKEIQEINNPFTTYNGVLVEITDYSTNAFDKRYNDTLMAELGPKSKIVEKYNEYVKDIAAYDFKDEVYYKYINKVILFPAILFVAAIAGILVILLFTLKKKKFPLAPSISALAFGLLNIINLVTCPLFLLASVKTLTVFGAIYVIVTLIGLINLIIDAKALKAAK